ncbi:MAG: ribosome biogenesis GTPase Der, partial [bacterium]
MSIPVVAIVGRPNVGKSALFNRIAQRQISLVFDKPGVTRDRIAADCQWQDVPFTLVDTGGIGLEDNSGLEEAIEREVNIAVEAADDLFLVVDGREGLQALDTEIARRLRRSQRRVWVIVNKMDSPKQSNLESDFAQLGFSEVWPVSAAHGTGVGELMSALCSSWKKEPSFILETTEKRETRPLRLAIVGKPNAGKSSLINAILKEERLIVSHAPGTTRDAVDIEFRLHDTAYTLMDTAGMRKRRRVSDPLEMAMTGRSAHAINRADVCALVMDAAEGVGEQEKKIAGLIQEAKKPCLLVVNKWDLTKDNDALVGKQKNFRQQYEDAVRRELFFLDYAPVLFISAKDKWHIESFLDALSSVEVSRAARISTGVLNRIIQRAMQRQLPPR